jgi:glycosyltransferase involved in cell wall biosynthesis
MRVGVYFGFGDPKVGGGFTFQHSVSSALAELAGESRHKFVLLGSPNVVGNSVSNIEVLSLGSSVLRRHFFGLFPNWVRRPLRQMLFTRYGEARRFLSSGFDMIWHVGSSCLTMEIPYIFTVFDLQHLVQPYFPEVSVEGEWENRETENNTVLRRASRIIVSTNVGKAEIERFYQVPPERIVVLPYAAPEFPAATENAGGEVLIKYGIPCNYLFYPAQFWPQKNHIGLLHAVKYLRQQWDISLPVVFVGSDKGNLSYVKEWVVKLGLSDQVHILGFVPWLDLIALYKNALALTMPTLVGPDNIPSLEAFKLGCPVITSNLPGFDEQLGNAALLVDPKDTKQIAAAIKSLYENSVLRNTLVDRGFQKAGKWTWRDYVRGVFKVLDDFEPIRRSWSTNPYSMRRR